MFALTTHRALAGGLASLAAAAALLAGCSRDLEKGKRAYLQSGIRYMEKGKYEQATLQFQNALKLDPRYADAFYQMGRAYLANHDDRAALGALNQAVELEPKRSDVHVALGQLYLNAQLYPKAEEEAALAVRNDPANPAAYQTLGVALSSQKQVERAVEAFSRVVELQPGNASALVNRGLAVIGLNRYADAEADLRKAIELDPHLVAAYTNLANLHRLERRMPEGESVLREGVQRNPDDASLYLALADLLFAAQRTAEADAALNRLRDRQFKAAATALAIGDFYLGRGEMEKAIAEYRRGISIDGGNTGIQNRLTDCYLAAGRLDEAEKLNAQTLKQRPKDIFAGIARGRILLARGNRAEAVAELQRVVALAQDSAPAHYALALAYWQNHNLPQAKTELLNVLRIAPEWRDARRSLAELHLALGEVADARAVSGQLVQDQAAGAGEHVLLGKVYLRQKEPAKAREQFLAARQSSPDTPDIALWMAQAYAGERKWAEAENELETVLKRQPKFVAALEALVNLWVGRGEAARAVLRTEQYVRQDPGNPQAHLLLGRLCEKQHRNDAAKAELARAAELDPKMSEAYGHLGDIYRQEGNIDAAIREFDRFLKVEPNSPLVETLIADLYRQKKDRDMAEKHYQQALSLDPGFVMAINNLAWMYATTGGNLDVALSLARKAKQLQPDSVVATDTLGWVQYKKGLYDGAVQLLGECVAKAPDSPTYRYHFGMALMAGGDKARARSELQAALRLKLPEDDAQDARKSLAQMK